MGLLSSIIGAASTIACGAALVVAGGIAYGVYKTYQARQKHREDVAKLHDRLDSIKAARKAEAEQYQAQVRKRHAEIKQQHDEIKQQHDEIKREQDQRERCKKHADEVSARYEKVQQEFVELKKKYQKTEKKIKRVQSVVGLLKDLREDVGGSVPKGKPKEQAKRERFTIKIVPVQFKGRECHRIFIFDGDRRILETNRYFAYAEKKDAYEDVAKILSAYFVVNLGSSKENKT